MGHPVVHFEIRSPDPDATRAFYRKLLGWTYPDGGMPGYTYIDSGAEGAVPGGISPLQGGESLVTFFAGVEDVAAAVPGRRDAQRPPRPPVGPVLARPGRGQRR
jgi:uncharacterized protein